MSSVLESFLSSERTVTNESVVLIRSLGFWIFWASWKGLKTDEIIWKNWSALERTIDIYYYATFMHVFSNFSRTWSINGVLLFWHAKMKSMYACRNNGMQLFQHMYTKSCLQLSKRWLHYFLVDSINLKSFNAIEIWNSY